MQIQPLAPFGAAVTGFDCSAQVADPAALANLIARHRVIVFRRQTLDDTAFLGFLSSLGPLMFTPGEVPVPGAPMLNIVTNTGRTTPPVSRFHTDTSYVAHPPAFTALRPVLLPERGGCTLFTDQVRAAARLPARWLDCLGGRQVLHRCTGLPGHDEDHWQPLFRRHPETGETALYLSTPARCVAMSGLDLPTSQRILTLLYRRSQTTSAIYRHIWQPGDLLIWDNRVTMHRADHSDTPGDRTLHRGMVAGERPLPAYP